MVLLLRDAGRRFLMELDADKIDQLLWEEWLSQQQLFLDHHRGMIICLRQCAADKHDR